MKRIVGFLAIVSRSDSASPSKGYILVGKINYLVLARVERLSKDT